MPAYKPIRLRRFAAFLCDFYGAVALAFFVTFLVMLVLPPLEFFCAVFCAAFAMGYLYCRDWLIGGRSIGKRLCGLSVVDCATNGPATGRQLLRKNLCFFFSAFDAFALLLTGRSIGERISQTAVVPGKIPAPMVKQRFVKFLAVSTVLALVVGFGASYGVNQSKKNESYALAYAYLTESETFTGQEREDAHISLTGFSSKTTNDEKTHAYTFETRLHFYTVTCHLQPDGTWAVCTECTEFA